MPATVGSIANASLPSPSLQRSLPAGGNSLADYGFAENVGPADFPVVEEEDAESDDAEESGASRLSARRVAGIMSPTNEFEQSRLHAGRRAAEVMSPLGAGVSRRCRHC